MATKFKAAIYEPPEQGLPMLAVTIINGVVEARTVNSRAEGMDALAEARWMDERRREMEARYAPRTAQPKANEPDTD